MTQLTSSTNATTSPFRFRPAVERLDERLTPTVTFDTPQTFGTGRTPQSVAVADFNGDGRPDIATVNEIDNTVSVLRNTTGADGVPTFATHQFFGVGFRPQVVVAADFDGDGRADLAVTNTGQGAGTTVSVLRNATTAGSSLVQFGAHQQFVVGAGPTVLTAADLDGDGRTDLAIGNVNEAAISILRNTTAMGASLSFAAPLKLPSYGTASGIAVGDFNADGRTDVAASHVGYSAGVVIFRNTTVGTLSFAIGQHVPGSRLLAVGDFDGDGRPDLALADGNALAGNERTAVATNGTAAGTDTFVFALQEVSPVVVGNSWSVVAADLDGDGWTDLAGGKQAGVGIADVLRNTTAAVAALSFDRQTLDLGPDMVALTLGAADLNGDGRPELIAANNFLLSNLPGAISVLRNTSAGGTVGTPNLVGQLGTTGVWAYDHTTDGWRRRTASNASALATAPNGDIAANFPGFGVYHYRASADRWTRINGYEASAVAIDRWGNAYANFRGFGTYVYRLATNSWARLPGTTAAADKLAVSDNGDVIADFPGFGVYRYRTADGWVQLNGFNTTSLAVDGNGFVVAGFRGVGIGRYIPYAHGWQLLLAGVSPTALAVDGGGNVYAGLPGAGVNRWSLATRTWTNLTPYTQLASLAADFYGNVYAGLAGFGVWEYRPSLGWLQRRLTDAGFLRAA